MGTKVDKLSISIVAYNNYEDIKKCLNTMEEYTGKKFLKKIYIIDNGVSVSNEQERKDFLIFLNNISCAEYIDAKENLGFGKAHNLILNSICSEYHAIVNPDIIFFEDAFSKIMNWMDENKEVGMVIPNIVDDKMTRQHVYREELTIFDMFIRMFCKGLFKNRQEKHTMQDKDYSRPFQVPFGQGSFLVIRTELFKKLNGFDDKYFMYLEDADLCKRLNQISCLMYYPGANVIHKWEKGSHKNRKLFMYHLNSMGYYFKKWGYKFF